mmetsp:Transcript_29343/g.93933  ORF Transcript_29343/g.93933 Transcript_29343/m.93933 type:complete len:995 (+) Transcript_29343:36-3020(+)
MNPSCGLTAQATSAARPRMASVAARSASGAACALRSVKGLVTPQAAPRVAPRVFASTSSRPAVGIPSFARGSPIAPGLAASGASRISHTALRAVATTAGDTAAGSPYPEPPALSGADIRKMFLEFYESKGHARLPSSSLVPEDPTVLLTIAGMLQFKPIFLGQVQRSAPCATTTQKCIRTNDIENVGVTKRHHTFFEMLGNFSFGDYFKTEAIQYAWELSTEVYKIPPELIYVSVFEKDDEAFAIWRDVVGVPEERIKRMGAKDNFWASGPTGPCGPCSELYYDFTPAAGAASADLEDDDRFIEFYNLVFMESNRDTDGKLTPLANKNIDTGMGLERMAQILQRAGNNYETDLIKPILDKAAGLAGIEYDKSDEMTKTRLKVIGDHVRAVTYMISDGIKPSNMGRGYIVRRLTRRVIRNCRLLGIDGAEGAFTPKIAEVAVALSGDCDPQVAANAEKVYKELTLEEARFTATLERGEKLLEELLAAAGEGGTLAGVDAFTLYDTYGFPLEITEEVAAERGVAVDLEGFKSEMAAQRKRAQAAHETVDLTASPALASLESEVGATSFTGYSKLLQEGAAVKALLMAGEPVDAVAEGDLVQVVLDSTPFYAESGGQVGDQGVLISGGGARLRVSDCQKAGTGLFVHSAVVEEGDLTVGDTVAATVDSALRRRLACNHTATHLLQSALKAVLGEDVSQAGSLVGFQRLRFDFNAPEATKAEELAQVEALVNQWIGESHGLQTQVMAIADAKEAGATAMFGEKYGAEVRVVDVPGVSMELCGGTHVSNTAEIGALKIVSESGIAAGVRRIEAVAGPCVMDYLNERDAVVKQLSAQFKVKPEEVAGRVASMQEELKSLSKELTAAKSALASAKSDGLLEGAVDVGGGKLLVGSLGEVDAASLSEAAQRLQQKLGASAAVVLGAVPGEGKVTLVAAFGPDLVKGKKLNAGKVIGAAAKICGGGGGGRPNLAQAGGRDPSKLDEALAKAKADVEAAMTAEE